MVAERRRTLVKSSPETEIIKVEQGRVFVREKDIVVAHSIEGLDVVGPEDHGAGLTQADKEEGGQGAEDNLQGNREAESLLTGPSIDPDKVSISDIRRYEALMKGKAVAATSNAQAPRGAVERNDRRGTLYKRHNWIASGEDEFGPMEMEFESASHLISLNIDLTFSCRNPSQLLEEGSQHQEGLGGGSSLVDDGECRSEDRHAASRPAEAIKSLGQFTIKGVEGHQALEEPAGTARSGQQQA